MEASLQQARGADLKAWRRFEADLEALSAQVTGLKIAYTLFASEKAAAERGGMQFPAIDTRDIFKRLSKLSDQALGLNYAYLYTQTLQAGIKRSKKFKEDIDIILTEAAAQEIGPKQVERATVKLKKISSETAGPLGVAPVVIVAGVAVVALVVGAVITVAALRSRADKLQAEIKKGRQAIERAALGNPAALAEYRKLRQTENHAQGEAWIDKLLGPGAGKAITGGILGLGLALVAAWILFKYSERKA